MNRPLAALAFLALPVFGTCAELIKAPETGQEKVSKYAPTNETRKPGVVSYKTSSNPKTERKRREEAYKIMYKTCGGQYQIVSETAQVETKGFTSYGYAVEKRYAFISFDCAAQP